MNKKSEKLLKPILMYDLKSIPHEAGLDMEMIVRIFEDERLVLWDSSKGGSEPRMLFEPPEGLEIIVADLSTPEGKRLKEERIKKEKIK